MNPPLPMKRKSVVAIYLLLLSCWVLILYHCVDVTREQDLGHTPNLYFIGTLLFLLVSALVYVHYYVTPSRHLNFIITPILFKLAENDMHRFSYYDLITFTSDYHLDIEWGRGYVFLGLINVCVKFLIMVMIVREILPEKWLVATALPGNVKRQTVVVMNLLLLVLWMWVLMSYVGMQKIEYYSLDISPSYELTVWAIYFGAIIYARLFVSNKFLLNVVVSSLLVMGAHYIRSIPTDLLISYLMKRSSSKDPLGWYYDYRFLDLAVMNIFLLLAFEIVRDLVPGKWRPGVV